MSKPSATRLAAALTLAALLLTACSTRTRRPGEWYDFDPAADVDIGMSEHIHDVWRGGARSSETSADDPPSTHSRER